MFTNHFGIEIEFTGITRRQAADVAAQYLGGTVLVSGDYYGTHRVTAPDGRVWKFMSDGSIDCQRKDGRRTVSANSSYSVELVSPILLYREDIDTVQGLARRLRKAGGFANQSCGIHIHVDASKQTAQSLRNLVNIMVAKEDLLFKALGVTPSRAMRWCKKAEPQFITNINRFKPRTRNAIENLWYGERSSSYHSHYDNSRYHALNLHSLWQGKGIEFRCFNGTTHAGKLKTYIQLCLAICNQAMTQRGASARKTETSNEKYTFRTWLLRMGMIGEEFDTARKFLLENLDGDIAFRNGRPDRAAA